MKLHKGEIAKKVIGKSGISITQIARSLGIGRNTLYSKLKDPNLSDDFIRKLENVIHLKLSTYFPELEDKEEPFSQLEYLNTANRVFDRLYPKERKYIALLEEYNALLSIIILASRNSKSDIINDELIQLVCD